MENTGSFGGEATLHRVGASPGNEDLCQLSAPIRTVFKENQLVQACTATPLPLCKSSTRTSTVSPTKRWLISACTSAWEYLECLMTLDFGLVRDVVWHAAALAVPGRGVKERTVGRRR